MAHLYSTVQYSTQYTVHSTGGAPGDAVVLPGAAGPVPPLLVHEGKHTPLPVLRLTTWNFMMIENHFSSIPKITKRFLAAIAAL